MDSDNATGNYDDYPFFDTPFYDFNNDGHIDDIEESMMMSDKYLEHTTVYPQKSRQKFDFIDFFIFRFFMSLFKGSGVPSSSRKKRGSRRGGHTPCLSWGENFFIDLLCFLCLAPLASKYSRRAEMRRYGSVSHNSGGVARSGIVSPSTGGSADHVENFNTKKKSVNTPTPSAACKTASASNEKSPCSKKASVPAASAKPADYCGDSWRLNCESGAAYGIDPGNYKTLEQYNDALKTAKFAMKFRSEHKNNHSK